MPPRRRAALEADRRLRKRRKVLVRYPQKAIISQMTHLPDALVNLVIELAPCRPRGWEDPADDDPLIPYLCEAVFEILHQASPTPLPTFWCHHKVFGDCYVWSEFRDIYNSHTWYQNFLIVNLDGVAPEAVEVLRREVREFRKRFLCETKFSHLIHRDDYRRTNRCFRALIFYWPFHTNSYIRFEEVRINGLLHTTKDVLQAAFQSWQAAVSRLKKHVGSLVRSSLSTL